MRTCHVCGKTIPEDGWGDYAYCTPDGHDYIHHACDPEPPTLQPAPEPTPAPPGATHSPPDGFLTLKDAAALLDVSVMTLRRRIKDKTLPAFRLAGGQTILVQRAALLKLLHQL